MIILIITKRNNILQVKIKYVILNRTCILSELQARRKSMVYNYNKLWKILIDRKITKTELRLQSGISTNMLAKMGKDEPVSMETLAKISMYLGCGLDDIVEIKKEVNND